MRLASFASLLVSFALVCLPACGPTIELGGSTKGDSGKVSFRYSSSQCAFGCALDRPVLQGALITVQVRGASPDVRHELRLTPASIGTMVATETCTCERQESASSVALTPVDPPTACPANQKKTCQWSADIQTSDAGDARLLLVDPAGATIDSAGFAVRPADRIETVVKVAGAEAAKGEGGAYLAHVGDPVSVHSTVFSGDTPMVFTKHGLLPTYSDTAVLASAASRGLALGGATDVEDAVAEGAGTASLTMQATGAAAVITVRVVP